MITISLCMIVKNEEGNIADCLNSVKDIVDEIIIVDTGSTDRTKEVVSLFTDKIYDFEWIHDFSAARNFSFSKATKEYILWLDADDVILEEDRIKLKDLKSSLNNFIDSVSMRYNYYDSNGDISYTLRRNRLVRRDRGFQWIGAIHEYISVYGNVVSADIDIKHNADHTRDTYRNLMIYDKMLASGKEFTTRDLMYYANELSDLQFYNQAIEKYQEFLLREDGWVEDQIKACNRLGNCYDSLGDYDGAIKCAMLALKYDRVRAETCCLIGDLYMKKGKYKNAIVWFDLATNLEIPKESWGFFTKASWTWYPHLQLTVCYDKMKDYEKGNEHNEKASQFIPNDSSVLQNRIYFASKLK